jgi:hypothetical protein
MQRRRTTILIAASALAALFAAGGYWAERYFSRQAPAVEIGVFFPGTDDGYWNNFVEGVRLAAGAAQWKVDDEPGKFECLVELPSTPVRFRWYPEVGSRGLKRRAAQLCQEARPPLAVVGANNSWLTQALAGELAQQSHSPVLLMTTATMDELLDLHPGKSFRFGINNSAQAESVVRRLADRYRELKVSKPDVHAILVDVVDDPFAVDLARRFETSLAKHFAAKFAPAPAEFRRGGGRKASWSLPTSTGSFDSPSDTERRFAEHIARVITADPDKEWVIVLPLDTSQYRRISYALTAALKSRREAGEKARNRLTVLSGDSLGYYDFHDAVRQQIFPEETPAPVIFFSHSNPIDPSHSGKNGRPDAEEVGLDRELAKTLLTVLSKLGPDATPEELAKSMTDYVATGSQGPYFQHGQRLQGGGAIVAIPRPEKQDFELQTPAEWAPAKTKATSLH